MEARHVDNHIQEPQQSLDEIMSKINEADEILHSSQIASEHEITWAENILKLIKLEDSLAHIKAIRKITQPNSNQDLNTKAEILGFYDDETLGQLLQNLEAHYEKIDY